jgi:hypothetical protein
VVKRLVPLVVLVAALSAAAAQSAAPSRFLLKGIYDEANTLYGNPDQTFRTLGQLRTRAVRLNLHWGGRFGVAGEDPTVRDADPNDGQYDWRLYDRAVLYATQYKIQVVFSIVSTPNWANGRRGPRVAPRDFNDLRDFAYAAAIRYSGGFKRPGDGRVLPKVRYWLAWNEPNNPIWLSPQSQRGRFVSPRTYARICNAVVTGIKRTLIRGNRVACGVTAPRGNNNPRSSRPSISPLAFVRGMKRWGARGFDAYAHHPYYGRPSETPRTRPPNNTAVTLGNIGVLDREVRRLYGPKRLWLTEYGYQTRPQDRVFGVSYAKQAAYLRQAYSIARRHPRIDMLLWFMLRDDTNRSIGWQSGFVTANGRRKPSFNVFRSLR